METRISSSSMDNANKIKTSVMLLLLYGICIFPGLGWQSVCFVRFVCRQFDSFVCLLEDLCQTVLLWMEKNW